MSEGTGSKITDSDLFNKLTDIRGVGDATAGEIINILEDRRPTDANNSTALKCESCGFVEPIQGSAEEHLYCSDCGGFISRYAEHQFESTSVENGVDDELANAIDIAHSSLTTALEYHASGRASTAERHVREAYEELETLDVSGGDE